MVTSSVQIILFNATEIVNVELKGMPLRYQRKKDMQNMSFIEKTCLENPDLLDYADENSDAPYPEDGEDGV